MFIFIFTFICTSSKPENTTDQTEMSSWVHCVDTDLHGERVDAKHRGGAFCSEMKNQFDRLQLPGRTLAL